MSSFPAFSLLSRGWKAGKLALLLAFTFPAFSQAATLPVLNANGATVQMNMQTDGAGALSPRNIICDASNPDLCAPVSATTGLTTTVLQPTPSLLNATVVQSTAAALNATVVQSTGSNLHVAVDSCVGCAAGGGFADQSTFTPGTTVSVPSGGFFQTTATNNALTNLQGGAVQLTANRAVFTNLRNASGTEIGTAATPVQVSLANTGANGTALVDTATINQGGSALSTTNGLYTNLLQSNAVLSAGNPLFVANQPQTSGGLSYAGAIVPNNTTSVAVGTSAAHQLYGIDGFSIAATIPAFIKLYNATQGSTTCGSGTPVARYEIPASGGTAGSGVIMSDANGVAFSTALTYCVTTGITDADATAPAANTYVLNIRYK